MVRGELGRGNDAPMGAPHAGSGSAPGAGGRLWECSGSGWSKVPAAWWPRQETLRRAASLGTSGPPPRRRGLGAHGLPLISQRRFHLLCADNVRGVGKGRVWDSVREVGKGRVKTPPSELTGSGPEAGLHIPEALTYCKAKKHIGAQKNLRRLPGAVPRRARISPRRAAASIAGVCPASREVVKSTVAVKSTVVVKSTSVI